MFIATIEVYGMWMQFRLSLFHTCLMCGLELSNLRPIFNNSLSLRADTFFST